ncbi:MAG TPA: aldose 1-epimerase [Ramlibacter sp.]|nr:aldose 1-epimerase [Ramlibacter sp.]
MIELQAGRLRCELHPGLGGCVAGLWMDGQPVLRSTPAAELANARLSGCYPLVPFSNRIAHAKLVWQGTQHPLVRNNGDEPHAIHGVGWQRPWGVLDQDGTTAMLAYEHRPDSGWPFAFDCSDTFRLTPSGLEMTLAITNQAPQPAPAGLGWHPYFVKRPGSRVAFRAAGRWEMGPDKLPTVRTPTSGVDAACADLDIDHCFDGWDGAVQLRDAVMQVRVRSDLTRVVVFTNDTRPYVAIEPVSHVNNAMQLHAGGTDAAELGLRVLQPGETMLAQMVIEVEPAR